MSRNKNVAPRIIISILVLGGAALSAYEQVQHSNSSVPGSHSSTSQHTSASQNSAPTVAELPNASCHANGVLPDPNCTPGAINPNVTQENIQLTICVSGYTKTIRPSVSYTDKLKAQQMNEYGYNDSIRLHEEDHLVSLELGGSPDDPKNLWPEPGASPNPKDKVENFLHAAVCADRITLHAAQLRIMTDWTTAEAGL
jgi:hypothetical protein